MNSSAHIPLAERMRPGSLEDYIGQKHIIGQGSLLYNQIRKGTVPSLILWGPPGTGKTSLAHIIAKESKRPFYTLSAVHSGVKDVREVINKAKLSGGLFTPKNPILFIDEIHRFSKSQQDSLLEAVEKGMITLIGATTENPSFEVISALLSRCQVYVLEPLGKEELEGLLYKAVHEDTILREKKIELKETSSLIRYSGGDARRLLNLLEMLVYSGPEPVVITDEMVQKAVKAQSTGYDKNGEQHYDIISAFIKSVRGSDPNAALYWLARMIEGGEDVKFIARRMIILSSEDIGNANPNALVLANATFDAVSKIGLPEARIILAQCAVYLASSPKSNSSYKGIDAALEEVRQSGNLAVPLHLRNAPTRLMKELGYGKDYGYAHAYPGNFVEQEYLPGPLSAKKFYEPGDNPKENAFRAFLKKLWKSKYGY